MAAFEDRNKKIIEDMNKAGRLIPPMNNAEKILLEKATDIAEVEKIYRDAERYYQSNNPAVFTAVQALHREHVDTINKQLSMKTVWYALSLDDSVTPEQEENLIRKLDELRKQFGGVPLK